MSNALVNHDNQDISEWSDGTYSKTEHAHAPNVATMNCTNYDHVCKVGMEVQCVGVYGMDEQWSVSSCGQVNGCGHSCLGCD